MALAGRIVAAPAAGILGLSLCAAVGSAPLAGALPQLSAQSNFAVCPTDPAQPLTEPEALQSIDAFTTDGSAYAQQLSKGSGVSVAVLGDGIDANSPAFIRSDGRHVISDYRDFSGAGPSGPSDGRLAFGSVSAIASQGDVSYDLSTFVNQAHPLPAGCNIKILGVAPDASIVALRTGEAGASSVSSIVQAISYATNVAHVKVIDEPFSVSQFPDASSRAAIQQANHRAVAKGVTVVEAAGDGGPNGTIGSDAADPDVISTGASTEARADVQTTRDAAQFGNGRWADDTIASSSSGGFSEQGRTVDLVAPGGDEWAACGAGFSGCTSFTSPPQPSSLQVFGGTAQASALTAGTAALVISAYRSTHHGKSPSPAVVKQIITGTTSDLGVPPALQGAGLLNAESATKAALTWPGATTTTPAGAASAVVASRDQVVLAADPGKTAVASLHVRDVGKKPLTIAVGTRRQTVLSRSTQAVSFDATTLPAYSSALGTATAAKQLHFTVPSGAALLAADVTWAGTRDSGPDAPLTVTLLGPGGAFIAASQPQGGVTSPNAAGLVVRAPAHGTWTAVLSSPAGSPGYDGTVAFRATATRSRPVGSVRPAHFTLKAGQSRQLTVHAVEPKTDSGDVSDALTLVTSQHQRTSVGLTVRPLVDPRHRHSTFSGTIIGGDGQPGTPAQTVTYPITVPAKAAGLDATVSFIDPGDHNAPAIPGEPVEAMLVDPHGNLADLASNNVPAAPGSEAPGSRLQAIVARPAAGRWELVVAAANPVPGTELEQDFVGRVALHGLTVRASGLPASAKTVLKPRSVHTVRLHVTNNGRVPLLLGLDSRGSRFATYQPVPVTGQTTMTLPVDPRTTPTYEIPPDTRTFTVLADSTSHAQVETHAPGGGIDVAAGLAASSRGALSTATASRPAVGSFLVRGLWGTSLQEVGPFADPGQPAAQSSLAASLSTLAFNATITTQVDDPYRDLLLGRDSSPLVFLKPGRTATIAAHLTAPSVRGTQVSGRLNLVTLPSQPTGAATSLPARTTGEVVATLPFRYTVTPLPRLSVRVPHVVHRGTQFVVTVSHHRAAVLGATVHFDGSSKRTSRNGRAVFTVSRHAHLGTARVRVTLRGHSATVRQLTVRP